MITNQPVHSRTLAVSASSTATSAVNLSPKPVAYDQPFAQSVSVLRVDVCLRACVCVSGCMCVCVLQYVCMCFCVQNQTFSCREALTPNFRCEQGKTAEPDDASNWKMLIVQDGSAHSARALSSTPTATGRAHLAHPRHGSPALFMLVGDSVLEMRRAQRPEYSLVCGRSLRKSRRHHLRHQDRPGLIAVPCAEHQNRPPLFLAQSIKAACAAKSRPRAVTSPCVSQSSQP